VTLFPYTTLFRSEVKDGANVAEGPALHRCALELVGVDAVREAQRHQMFPLLRVVQAVDYEDVFETPPVECPNKSAAYQASAPGNDDSSTAKIVHKAPEISNPPGQRPSPLAGKMQAIRK
jgi:hypothetical protein